MAQRNAEVIDFVQKKIREYRENGSYPQSVQDLKDAKDSLVGLEFRIPKLQKELEEMEASEEYTHPSFWDRLLRKVGLVDKFEPKKESYFQTKRFLSRCLEKENAAINLIEKTVKFVDLELNAKSTHPEWFKD